MNFSRLAVATAAAWLAHIALGYLIYEGLVRDLWRQPGSVFRVEDVNLVLGFASSFAGLFLFAYMYAKGYEGGSGMQEGLRFGALVGVLLVCFGVVWTFAVVPMPGTLALYLAAGTVLQLTLSGIIVGVIYRPAPGRPRRSRA